MFLANDFYEMLKFHPFFPDSAIFTAGRLPIWLIEGSLQLIFTTCSVSKSVLNRNLTAINTLLSPTDIFCSFKNVALLNGWKHFSVRTIWHNWDPILFVWRLKRIRQACWSASSTFTEPKNHSLVTPPRTHYKGGLKFSQKGCYSPDALRLDNFLSW